jgi:hypothetical protein
MLIHPIAQQSFAFSEPKPVGKCPLETNAKTFAKQTAERTSQGRSIGVSGGVGPDPST